MFQFLAVVKRSIIIRCTVFHYDRLKVGLIVKIDAVEVGIIAHIKIL